jgi:hypothetical protein
LFGGRLLVRLIYFEQANKQVSPRIGGDSDTEEENLLNNELAASAAQGETTVSMTFRELTKVNTAKPFKKKASS